ncbi:MAG TPA: Lrp/AsnC family transcriptional regulator [Steroidobacteraceae bacterium]|nr:Lrp/AsnC family transcriptional regulator [Steroidobacteraceae bacterium]
MQIDRFDARILSALQQDGRLTVVELADSVGLSPTPCARRIKALEAARVIEGYAAVLNPTGIGLGVLALVQVKLTLHTDETVARFERDIELLDEVTNCYAVTGAYDFLLQVYAGDLDALSNVVLKKLLRIPHLRDLQSSVVLATVKRSGRLPLSHLPQTAGEPPPVGGGKRARR